MVTVPLRHHCIRHTCCTSKSDNLVTNGCFNNRLSSYKRKRETSYRTVGPLTDSGDLLPDSGGPLTRDCGVFLQNPKLCVSSKPEIVVFSTNPRMRWFFVPKPENAVVLCSQTRDCGVFIKPGIVVFHQTRDCGGLTVTLQGGGCRHTAGWWFGPSPCQCW